MKSDHCILLFLFPVCLESVSRHCILSRYRRIESMNPPAKTDKTVVVGDFEFSSIQLSSLEGKELSQTSQVYP